MEIVYEGVGKEPVPQATATDNVPKTEEKKIQFASSDKKLYSIPTKYAEYAPTLITIVNNDRFKQTKIDDHVVLEADSVKVDALVDYLTTGNASKVDFELLDYCNVPLPYGTREKSGGEEFIRIQLTELWQRHYTQDNPKVNKVLLRDVIDQIPRIAEKYSDDIVVHSPVKHFLLNKDVVEGIKESKKFRLKLLGKIDLSKYNGKVVLAGGSLISLLLNQPVNDYDIFFVDCTHREARAIIKEIITDVNAGYVTAFASKNSWTFSFSKSRRGLEKNKKMQFIFRNYKNMDEILLGFDVDSCCIAYDGSDIYLSERCLHALKYHVNVVDYTRMSPTYEVRLYKYSKRGFDVHASGFDAKLIEASIYTDIPSESSNFKMYVDQKTGALQLSISSSNRRNNRYSRYRGSKRVRQNGDYRSKVSDSDSSGNDSEDGKDRKRNGKESDDESVKSEDDTVNVDQVPGETGNMTCSWDVPKPFLSMRGLDILLFLSIGPQRKNRIKASDYSDLIGRKDKVLPVISFNDGGHKITGHYVAGKWIRIRFDQIRSTDIYGKVLKYCKAKRINQEWVEQNPGQQITSSFHALVNVDPEVWFRGRYYNPPQACKIPQKYEMYISINV